MQVYPFLFFPLFLCYNLTAQVVWEYDLNKAKQRAAAEDKFILLDFTAVWCGPCHAMDAQLWGTSRANQVNEKLVAVKINVDREPALAKKFGAPPIPKIVIITTNEEVLHEQIGFGGPQPYQNMIADLPNSSEGTSRMLIAKNRKDPANALSIAERLEVLARETTHSDSRQGLLNLSTYYARMVQKKSSDQTMINRAQFQEMLNLAHRGQAKKALKKLGKLEGTLGSEALEEFGNFVIAFCHKCEEDLDKLELYRARISKPEYLALLEN